MAKTFNRVYRGYLKSNAWAHKRAQVLFRDGNRCVQCGAGGVGLQVHHKTYARFGHENLNDLATVCQPCHRAIHQTQKHLKQESNYG